ncbi:MAG: hypothetical protein EOP11_05480 [Proteobacteria bacterium]|nr:MAG: hypothetical protein EOP11_05480 [Pseudomonadota bacterium]
MPTPIHPLLLIDDTKLRIAAAAAAEKLLRKLDRLSTAQENFTGLDQRLYQDWVNLTFREETHRLESMRRQIEALEKEKEAVLLFASQGKVSPEDAYGLLQDEKLRYELGTPEEKARIEDARRHRAKRPKDNREAKYEAREKRRAQAEQEEAKLWWDWLAALTKEQIKALAKDVLYSANTLLAALLTASDARMRETALRFWDETSTQVRKAAVDHYLEHGEADLEFFVENMRREQNRTEKPSSPGKEAPTALTLAKETLKILYRKFVRHLHPDAKAGVATTSWQMKMWHLGQEAYQSENYPALSALYRVVMLRLGRLGELTMSEILSIESGLREELRALEAETRGMRKAPYWKFSRRTDYFDLERGLRTGFERELKHAGAGLDSLRKEFETWRLIAEGRKGLAARSRQRGKSPPRRTRR